MIRSGPMKPNRMEVRQTSVTPSFCRARRCFCFPIPSLSRFGLSFVQKRTSYFTNKVTTLQVIAVEFLHDLGDLDKEALVLDLKRPDGTANLHEPCMD